MYSIQRLYQVPGSYQDLLSGSHGEVLLCVNNGFKALELGGNIILIPTATNFECNA